MGILTERLMELTEGKVIVGREGSGMENVAWTRHLQ